MLFRSKHGCFIEEFGNGCKLIAKGKRHGRMFILDAGIPELKATMFTHGSGVVQDIEMWHKRISHINIQKLKMMQHKNLVSGLPKFRYTALEHVCSACQFGKQSRLPFARHVRESTRPLQLIHSDVWGPAQTTSMGGSSYYVTFIDDFSRYTWLYFLKHKDEVLPVFKNFKRLVEKEFDAYITCLRSDNGGEYVSNAFDDFLAYHGIQIGLTCLHTP